MPTRFAVLAFSLVSAATTTFAGPLNPPSTPAPTSSAIEPRIAITALPATIEETGSYYLTRNFDVGATTAIALRAPGVTIDLNGFTISGTRLSNPEGFSVRGIDIQGSDGFTIVNGTIQGFGIGIFTAGSSGNRISDIRVHDCGVEGMETGQHTVVENCRATGCAGVGFSAIANGVFVNCIAAGNANGFGGNGGSSFEGCVAEGNDGVGISAFTDNNVVNCIAIDNGGDGITANNNGSVIRGCTVNNNGGSGIVVSSWSVVEDCNVSRNAQNGILVTSEGCLITGNDCVLNGSSGTGAGILLEQNINGGNRIEGNHLNRNIINLQVLGPENIIMRNTARAGNGVLTTNYSIAAGNAFGAIATVNGVGSFSGETPNANFSF